MRSAEDCGKPLAPRDRGKALGEVRLRFSRELARSEIRVALRKGGGPLRRVAEAVGAAGDTEEQCFSLIRSGVSQVSPYRSRND
jgi:hypothetical protein